MAVGPIISCILSFSHGDDDDDGDDDGDDDDDDGADAKGPTQV